MRPVTIVLICVAVVLLAAVIVLYFLGKKTQKKQEEQQAQMDAAAQTVVLTIIDKKRMRMQDAGFPEAVTSQIPWYGKFSKVPIVKCKIGPKIMNLLCEAELFEVIPVRKEVKATVSGLYLTAVRGSHGKLEMAEKKKKGFRAKMMAKSKEANEALKAERARREQEKAAKNKKK